MFFLPLCFLFVYCIVNCVTKELLTVDFQVKILCAGPFQARNLYTFFCGSFVEGVDITDVNETILCVPAAFEDKRVLILIVIMFLI